MRRTATWSRSMRAQHVRGGRPQARVKELLGSIASEKAISLIAIQTYGIPSVFPREVLAEAEAAKPADCGRPRRLATTAADHHRSGRRQRPRRRRPCRARRRRGEPGRLHRHGRDRRRCALRHARQRARSRSAGARQLGLFPRPRRADAARAHLQRSLLAAPARGSRRARRPHGDRRRRAQTLAHLPSHSDALGRQARLHAGAGRDRRHSPTTSPAPCSNRSSSRFRPPTRRSRKRAISASRSTSICPSARSSSSPTAASIA